MPENTNNAVYLWNSHHDLVSQISISRSSWRRMQARIKQLEEEVARLTQENDWLRLTHNER